MCIESGIYVMTMLHILRLMYIESKIYVITMLHIKIS